MSTATLVRPAALAEPVHDDSGWVEARSSSDRGTWEVPTLTHAQVDSIDRDQVPTFKPSSALRALLA